MKPGAKLEAASVSTKATAQTAAAAEQKSATDAAHRKAVEITRKDYFLIRPLAVVITSGADGDRYAGVDMHASGLPDALYVLRRAPGQGAWVFLGYQPDAEPGSPRLGVPPSVWTRLFR